MHFSLSRPPKVIFGAGSIGCLGELAAGFGKTALLVKSRGLTNASGADNRPGRLLEMASVACLEYEVHGEPSPGLVDAATSLHRRSNIDVVIALGGGSAIDTGKAVSAMLPLGEPVTGYLEDVGTRSHPGNKVPFIAVPTTAGSGSEASGNAVLSTTGPDGFKKSLRHERLVPDVALVDPELAFSCPAPVTAACGLDAFTQLLESYVSAKASPVTDGLVESALPFIRDCLVPAATHGADDIRFRSGMSYAALISGITLANAGLGIVHGLASRIGGLFPVPHGIVCGTLLAEATEFTIASLMRSDPSHPSLSKYARAGSVLSGMEKQPVADGCAALLETIRAWTTLLGIPRLSSFGITRNDIENIVAGAGNKNNPAKLTNAEISEVVTRRL